MNPNETSVNGTRPMSYNGEQAEQPGTSSFNWTESSVSTRSTTPDYQEMIDVLFKPDELNSPLCNGPYLCEQCPIFQSLTSFPNDSLPCNEIFPSLADTERDHGSSPSAVSPVSTYSWPAMPSTPEDAETLNAMEGAKSALDSNCINVSKLENPVLPAAQSKPGCSRTCTGCVRPVSACHDAHRLTASEDAMKGTNFFKGVNKKKNSDKWTCEIRISKKIPKDSKLKAKNKLWLGTFDTQYQAARALHVGRFLLSEKKNSATDAAIFEKSSKTILSDFKDLMRAKPLDAELLNAVRELATAYGKNGSVTKRLASSNSSLGADLAVSLEETMFSGI